MFKSLISRAILLNVLLLSLGIGTFTLYLFNREQGRLVDASRLNANLLLNTIEKSFFNAMRFGNSDEVQAILEKIGDSEGLVGVQIFGPNGTILKSANPAEIGGLVDKHSFNLYVQQQSEGVFQLAGGPRVLTLVRPIVSDERCFRCHGAERKIVGVLSLNLSLAKMYHELRDSSEIFIFSTLFVLVMLAFGTAVVMIRLLRQPLQRITRSMKKVEAGDLSVRLESQQDDEVGQLVHGFNSMVGNLDKAQRELKQYHYRQMERAERLASIGEMAAGLAHEIKNPLAGISGAIDVLTDDYGEEDPRRDVMRRIQEQIGRLNKTVTDLLYFGRPGQPEFSYADINGLIKQTLMFVAQHPEAKNINRVEELTRNLPPVWIDQKQIQQVLLNVAINALQAMKDGGVLTVQTDQVERDEHHWVRIEVCDTGPGISADEMEKIFVPFYTSKTQGTGLGLPICRQLIESNGGAIRVDSELGQGTCFTLELPAVIDTEVKPPE